MRRRGQASLATAALIVLIVLSACTDSPDDPPAPTTTASIPVSSPAPSPTVSPTPTPTSDTKAAAANAEHLVRSYYALRDDLRTDTSLPLSGLKQVTIGIELSAEQHFFETERNKGWHQTGSTRIAELDVRSVNLDNSDPKAGRVPTVQIDVCYDVSGADLVDAHGTSKVTPGRADRGWIRYNVANYTWDRDPADGWRVASSQSLKEPACDAH